MIWNAQHRVGSDCLSQGAMFQVVLCLQPVLLLSAVAYKRVIHAVHSCKTLLGWRLLPLPHLSLGKLLPDQCSAY